MIVPAVLAIYLFNLITIYSIIIVVFVMICVINSSRFDRVIIPSRLVGDAGRGNDEAATEVQTIICSVTKLCDD